MIAGRGGELGSRHAAHATKTRRSSFATLWTRGTNDIAKEILWPALQQLLFRRPNSIVASLADAAEALIASEFSQLRGNYVVATARRWVDDGLAVDAVDFIDRHVNQRSETKTAKACLPCENYTTDDRPLTSRRVSQSSAEARSKVRKASPTNSAAVRA